MADLILKPYDAQIQQIQEHQVLTPDTFPPFWVGQKLQTGQTSLSVRTTPLVARTLDLLAHR